MSGFRGTFGSPEDDAVVSWIYGAMGALDRPDQRHITKLIQHMIDDRHSVEKIQDRKFRNRVALMVLDQYKHTIQQTFGVKVKVSDLRLRTGLRDRINNLAVRNYRTILRMK